MALRIAQLVSARRHNGAARVCGQMCDGLAERGHEVFLFHRPELDVASLVGPRVTCVPTTMGVSLGELRRVARLMAEHRIDVLHAHTTDAQKYAALLRLFWGYPSVVTAHNAHRFDFHWMAHTHVIALTEASRAYHRQVNRVADKRLSVIPNFIELPAPERLGPARRAAVRGALGLPQDALVIGAIGDIDKRKNQGQMVEAFATLVAAGVDAHLVLVGAVKDEGESRRCDAAAKAVPGRVHRLGFVADASGLLAGFDIFALAARFETLPLSVMEAMAHGLPIVGPKVGGVPDLVQDGVTGVLVAPGDVEALAAALNRLAHDEPLRAAMGAAGQARAAHFTRDATLDAVEAVLVAAAASGRSRHSRDARAAMAPAPLN